MTLCAWEGCDREKHRKAGRGLCAMHYQRAKRQGRIEQFDRVIPDYIDESERFFSRVEVTGFCWNWLGRKNNRGYPVYDLPTRQGVPVYAHRWAYEHLVGQIPEGLTIDHLCRRPICVNPDHMETVTSAENHRRMRALRGWK